MATLEEAKVLLEEGWKSREALDLDTARQKLTEAKKVFEENGEYRLVTEALNHLAYTEKLDATQHAAKALETALESEQVAIKNKTELVLIYRAIISTAETCGLFELALDYANKMLTLLEKPILKGDLLSHISTFELRTGQLEKSAATIEQALKLLEEGWESEREPHRTIWKLRALAAKAVIIYNQGNYDEAMEILANAKRIAIESDQQPRLKQIEMLINNLPRR